MLLLTLIPALGLCQNTVTGKIVDELGLPIYLASVEIDQTDKVVYTDYDGNFTLTSKKDFHWKINISSTGYKSESFFVLDGGKTEALVLEYDEEMKKLFEGDSNLNQKALRIFKKRFHLFPKPKNSLAGSFNYK